MTLLRGAEIDRFVSKPDRERPVILLFGPDAGLVSERAASIAGALVGDDALAISRFEEAELASEPGRLANEALGGSLFSGSRVIRIRAGGNRSLATELKALLAEPPTDTWIVIEAGDLRKTAPLRKLCEDSRAAAAIGCYPDNERSLMQLIDAEVAIVGASIDADARAALADLVGADRAGSRAEIRKLCIYAGEGATITLGDVVALIGDGAAFAVDDVVEAAAAGDRDGVERGLRRLLSAGTASSTIGAAAERHFLQLHRLRSRVESGASIPAALGELRPPPFPSRRTALERQLRSWSLSALNAALSRFSQAMTESRLNPPLADAIVGRTLLALAAMAGRSR